MTCTSNNLQPACVWTSTQQSNGWWKHVSKCGRVHETPPRWPTIYGICEKGDCLPDLPAEPDKLIVSTGKKVWSYFWANVRWIKAGRPTRTPEQVAAAYATCLACPQYDPHPDKPDEGTCKECGCRLAQIGGLRNKISMATEHCPLEKW